MAIAQVSTQAELDTSSERLVWVLNLDGKPYRASFRSMDVNIPANLEKVAKHARDGGNLMHILEAEKFLGDLKQPQGFHEDPNTGTKTPIFGPKALKIVEMTPTEYTELVGKSKDQIQKTLAKEEKAAGKKLTNELGKVPNKVSADEDDY
jgi:hypothetical protein